MIFVTVGHLPFFRLIKAMDALSKETGLKVIMQVVDIKGYTPVNTEFFDFMPSGEIDKYFQQADLIVSHCSSGPILKARKYNKPLVILPRMKVHNEHIDNHQMDFARAIQANNISGIWVIYDESDLKEAILKIMGSGFKLFEEGTGKNQIIDTIKEFLSQIR